LNATSLEPEIITKAPGETLDALFDGRVTLFQSRLGDRFSLDALLLASFASVKRRDTIVDLGCGNGAVCLALAELHHSTMLTGIDVQAAVTERARRSVRLNGLDGRITIITADVRNRRDLPKQGAFDVAVCNPPYRKPGSGRISRNDERRIARHELHGDVGDFLRAGAFLLRQKGRMALVYLAARSADLIVAMRQAGIEPKRLRMVHSFPDAEASLLLIEGVKGGSAGLTVLPPLVIYGRDKVYTDEVKAMIGASGKRAGG
jgi:tRNA1Val (adenine37-N6)-methyltransferase